MTRAAQDVVAAAETFTDMRVANESTEPAQRPSAF
jgi:hypothetical protein